MNELAMAIIKGRPVFVLQQLTEKLRGLSSGDSNQHNHYTCGLSEDENDVDEKDEDKDEEEEEEEEEEATDSERVQETAAKTIRALTAIIRVLTESAKIQQVVTSHDIQCATFRGTTFTDKEKAVAAKIVNFLRPFVQQRGNDNKLPAPHILTRAPLAALANTIATVIGFPSLVRKLSIDPEHDPRALQLTAAGIYDTFCGQWDIPIDDANWVTNSYLATKNKSATFAAFFNMNRVESLVDSYGLQFAWRLTFLDRWTVRLLGKTKPGKFFVMSNYEARRREKNNITRTLPTTKMPTLDRLEMEALAESHASQVKDLLVH